MVLCGSRAPSASTKAWRIPASRTVGSWESSKGFHRTTPSKSWSGCTLLRWAILVYPEGLSESPRAATTKFYRLGDINSIPFLQFWKLEVHDQGATRAGFWWDASSWLVDGYPLAVSSQAFPLCVCCVCVCVCVYVFVREKETHTHTEGERQREERRYVVFLFL